MLFRPHLLLALLATTHGVAGREAKKESDTPAVESIAKAVGDVAEERFDIMKAFISELISGKEPSFTESAMSRLSLQWYGATPAVAKATQAVADAAESAYSDVSRGVAAMATPPPQLESIISMASVQMQQAITAASEALYGTQKGEVEKATSAVLAAKSSATAVISSIIYGREKSAAEKVQKDIADALASAREQMSIAIMGTPQGKIESVTSVVSGSLSQATGKAAEQVGKAQDAVADGYSAVSKVVQENASAASSFASSGYSRVSASISTILYGPEKTYMESAQSRLDAAMQTASAQLKEMFLGRELTFGERVSLSMGQAYESAASAAGEAYNSAASVMSKATDAVKPNKEPEGVTDTVSSVASSIADEVKSKVAKLKDEL